MRTDTIVAASLAFACLSLSASVRAVYAQGSWLPTDSSSRSGVDYYDGSVQRSGQVVSFWARSKAPYGLGPIFVGRYDIDCQRRTIQTQHVDMYDSTRRFVTSVDEAQKREPLSTSFFDSRFVRKLCNRESGISVEGRPIERYTVAPVRTRWQFVAVSVDRDTVSVDVESMRRDGRLVTVWTRFQRATPLAGPNGDLAYSLERIEFDCGKHVLRSLSLTNYDSAGRAAASGSPNGLTDWTPVAPESVTEAVEHLVCRPGPIRRSDPPAPWGPPPASQ